MPPQTLPPHRPATHTPNPRRAGPTRQAAWLRRVYPHNPLYLVSVVLVLIGIQLASQGDPTASSAVTTPMLFGYIATLAAAGWLVVRVGKVWEDARTILLSILLMFMALSTSYDCLCLNDPEAGARRLAVAFAFSCVTVEALLAALRIRLPLLYRGPFYLQLAVLFAFPAYLGRLSIDGHDEPMCLGVLVYSLAAGGSLLTLWPAIVGRSLSRGDNGTPWTWPAFPWSVFVFVAIAMGVRSWMLSVSFSYAGGLDPAFQPYFLAPILLAMIVLALEIGLRHASPAAQRGAMATLPLVPLLAFPGQRLTRAQELSVGLLEESLAGPPLLVTLAVTVVGLYAIARRAAWAWPVTLGAAALLACLGPETRSFSQLHTPSDWVLAPIAAWLLLQGLRLRDAPRLAGGVATLLAIAPLPIEPFWDHASKSVAVWVLTLLLLAAPLVCRDAWSRWMRTTGPLLFAWAAPFSVLYLPPSGWDAPDWLGIATSLSMACLAVAYWARERQRWHLASAFWSGGVTATAAVFLLVRGVQNAHLQQGLTLYALGCGVLLTALVVSLWKAGLVDRLLVWLMQEKPPARAETA